MDWQEKVDIEVVDGRLKLYLTSIEEVAERHLVASITPQVALILGQKLAAMGLPPAPPPVVPEGVLHHLDDMRRLALKSGNVNYTERGKH